MSSSYKAEGLARVGLDKIRYELEVAGFTIVTHSRISRGELTVERVAPAEAIAIADEYLNRIRRHELAEDFTLADETRLRMRALLYCMAQGPAAVTELARCLRVVAARELEKEIQGDAQREPIESPSWRLVHSPFAPSKKL